MHHSRPVAAAVVTIAFALGAPSAEAAFHLWTFSEFYSNSDGSVQFIEMFSAGPFETVAGGAQIRTTSGNVFSFPGNLAANTQNRRLLIATPDFATLPGAVVPDYILPTLNFLNPAGDTIRLLSPLFGEFHSRTFSKLPANGTRSINYPPAAGVQAKNSPTNFSGAMGSVVPEPAVLSLALSGVAAWIVALCRWRPART
jgi:serralysin